ncbi:MAG: DUF2905 domain-containing protein [Acidobacteria bacterium]|nr:DUF2905 domain-containing protein [Acidobacteriota bacterium]
MPEFGKLLILVGGLLIILSLALTLGDRYSFFRIGRLPGDIVYRRGNFTFYFPLVTSILLSLLVTVLLWFFGRK